MEMMDRATYLDSFRESYETLRDAYGSALGGASTPDQWYAAAAPWYGGGFNPGGGDSSRAGQGGPGTRRRHGHEHGHGHECGCGHGSHEHGPGRDDKHGGRGSRAERDCGCGPEPDCSCECCIEDADIVVYAHCGEVRVVPIEIENDTRRARENVTVDVTDIRTAGGRPLSWQTLVTPEGPLTLEPCSTTKLEILVRINCGEATDDDTDSTPPGSTGPEDHQTPSVRGDLFSRAVRTGRGTGDLDECLVGYLTVGLGGCTIRPIVVAIAALPDSCDSYRTACSCSCCC